MSPTARADRRESVEKLYKQREGIEKEMALISQRLIAEGMPGLKGSLVDSEGFPISGVDLYAIRSDRQKYAVLKSDHVSITNIIQTELSQILSPQGGARMEQHQTQEQPEEAKVEVVGVVANDRKKVEEKRAPLKAFAVVDILTPSSPAEVDGLRMHDRVLSFCEATSISDVALLIRNNAGKSFRVQVNRAGKDIELNVTPRKWDGDGLLGAHFRQLNF